MKRLSRLFAPLVKAKTPSVSTHDLLSIHGYLRQSSSGVYNLLPLGLAVQAKIEGIIRRNLEQADCHETSLATLAQPQLWRKSGRLRNKAELFMLENSKYLLAPTNEEEITNVVSELSSYKQLPLRLYQITKKFRNERRPRGGLLRGREFTMKDLYSFDESVEAAHATYGEIQTAYRRIFEQLGVPFEVAEADSGAIGGSLSHEYHYKSDAGEDLVVSCDCGYTANIERAQSRPVDPVDASAELTVTYFSAGKVSDELPPSQLLVTVHTSTRQLNPQLVKLQFPEELQTSVEEIDANEFRNLSSLSGSPTLTVVADLRVDALPDEVEQLTTNPSRAAIVDAIEGEACPKCETPGLKVERAIEVAHTFYLGTKYSEPLGAHITTRAGASQAIQMGCYGIGVSRLIAAIAEVTRDGDGLAWPTSISPFDAVIVAVSEEDAKAAADALSSEGVTSVWDDRSSQFGALLGNARGIGFPLAIVLGKRYKQSGSVEIQPRTGSAKQAVVVPLNELGSAAKGLLSQ